MAVTEDGPGSPTNGQRSDEVAIPDTDSGLQASVNPTENQDELIRAQERRIETEIKERVPLVSDLVSLDVLLNEYSEDDVVYRNKIRNMKTDYELMRRTRPDGNCFFRAFAYAYFESLLNDSAELDRFSQVATKTKNDLIKLGVLAFTVEDFHDNFQGVLEQIRSKDVSTKEQLLEIFNESGTSDYLVVFLRLVTSCHLQLNAEFFSNFIEGEASVKEFCAQEVEPMYRESDHIHIISLTQCSGVNVRISYLDRGGSEDRVNTHDFPEGSTPRVHLLYRPGHYDIIYFNGSKTDSAN